MEDYILKKNTNILTEENHIVSVEFSGLLDSFLNSYEPISLSEMDKVQLMNRVDTKFLLNYNQLPYLLEKALEHYRVVEIDGQRISPYSSIYLDTENAEMYRMHHNRKLNRYKVRIRSYVNSGITFLEVKRKNNKGRTAKERIKIENSKFETITLDEAEQEFIIEKSPYIYSSLRPQLQNFFQRITFVDKQETERVTVDIGLRYSEIGGKNTLKINNLVVIEMKQSGHSHSFFRDYLKEQAIYPANMSKYCLGMILTYPNLKNNRFKKKLRLINKITNNKHTYATK